jgi:hypothetical protein
METKYKLLTYYQQDVKKQTDYVCCWLIMICNFNHKYFKLHPIVHKARARKNILFTDIVTARPSHLLIKKIQIATLISLFMWIQPIA